MQWPLITGDTGNAASDEASVQFRAVMRLTRPQRRRQHEHQSHTRSQSHHTSDPRGPCYATKKLNILLYVRVPLSTRLARATLLMFTTNERKDTETEEWSG